MLDQSPHRKAKITYEAGLLNDVILGGLGFACSPGVRPQDLVQLELIQTQVALSD